MLTLRDMSATAGGGSPFVLVGLRVFGTSMPTWASGPPAPLLTVSTTTETTSPATVAGLHAQNSRPIAPDVRPVFEAISSPRSPLSLILMENGIAASAAE